jgi:hypothetical protein
MPRITTSLTLSKHFVKPLRGGDGYRARAHDSARYGPGAEPRGIMLPVLKLAALL